MGNPVEIMKVFPTKRMLVIGGNMKNVSCKSLDAHHSIYSLKIVFILNEEMFFIHLIHCRKIFHGERESMKNIP